MNSSSKALCLQETEPGAKLFFLFNGQAADQKGNKSYSGHFLVLFHEDKWLDVLAKWVRRPHICEVFWREIKHKYSASAFFPLLLIPSNQRREALNAHTETSRELSFCIQIVFWLWKCKNWGTRMWQFWVKLRYASKAHCSTFSSSRAKNYHLVIGKSKNVEWCTP